MYKWRYTHASVLMLSNMLFTEVAEDKLLNIENLFYSGTGIGATYFWRKLYNEICKHIYLRRNATKTHGRNALHLPTNACWILLCRNWNISGGFIQHHGYWSLANRMLSKQTNIMCDTSPQAFIHLFYSLVDRILLPMGICVVTMTYPWGLILAKVHIFEGTH